MHKPHILVLGLRGVPHIQGGVEAHAEHLFPIIASGGYDVTVLLRSRYLTRNHPTVWKEVRLIKIWAPASQYLETFVHTLLGLVYAIVMRPDILHLHAIGPALFTPLARLFGLKVVVTHHGPDYDRQKWGAVSKIVLRFGEAMGMLFSNRQIVISKTIKNHVFRKYGINASVITNGVDIKPVLTSTLTIENFGLTPHKYILMVARFVPEKRQIDLIQSFVEAGMEKWKLVLVGAAEHETPYSLCVKELVSNTPNVIMTGFQTGNVLEELYSHAGMFILPSSHEGLPIVLLEALSYGLPVIVSDILPHLEIGLPQECYFKLGDTRDLSSKIRHTALIGLSLNKRENVRNWIRNKYDWHTVAQKTEEIYRSLLQG